MSVCVLNSEYINANLEIQSVKSGQNKDLDHLARPQSQVEILILKLELELKSAKFLLRIWISEI